MFGLDKIREARKKAEEIKERLEHITVEGFSAQNEVRVICSGSRRIVDIRVNESIFRVRDQKEVEQLIAGATNHALEQAERLAEAEMRAIMPNIPGL